MVLIALFYDCIHEDHVRFFSITYLCNIIQTHIMLTVQYWSKSEYYTPIYLLGNPHISNIIYEITFY